MHIGLVGLGKMGGHMAQRLLKGGHALTVFDKNPATANALITQGAVSAASLSEVVKNLKAPRIVWCMVPAGEITRETVRSIGAGMSKGDIIIDGGNSYYKDSQKIGDELGKKGIYFLDAGTSGGIWGLANGYCLMIGGDAKAFQTAESIFAALAPKDGYLHVGPVGAGHFVKMVHNGIEYGLLQAYAEGFEILKASPHGLNLGNIAHLWNQGSVVRSWLLELAEDAFNKNAELKGIAPYIADSGEGRWTVAQAIEDNIAAPVITLSLLQRLRSRDQDCFSDKVIAALRNEFGGHAIKED